MPEAPTVDLGRDQKGAGTAGFISWRRLVEALRKTGEFKEDEEVIHVVALRNGLQYYTEETSHA